MKKQLQSILWIIGILRLEFSQKYANKKEKDVIVLLDKLFDITKCKCDIYLCNHETSGCTGCHYGVHISYKCRQAQKIPILDLQWLYYQKQKFGDKSIFQMAGYDTKDTEKI